MFRLDATSETWVTRHMIHEDKNLEVIKKVAGMIDNNNKSIRNQTMKAHHYKFLILQTITASD